MESGLLRAACLSRGWSPVARRRIRTGHSGQRMDGGDPSGGMMAAEPNAAYRVLARKYRPKSFDDLVGQEPMVRTLRNAFATGRLSLIHI